MNYLGKKIILKKKELSNTCVFLKNKKTLLIGAFHYHNLGDIALSESIIEKLKQYQTKNKLGFIGHHKIPPIRENKYIFFAGGAIGTNHILNNFYDHFKGEPQFVNFVGLEFSNQLHNLTSKNLEKLKNAKTITVRIKQQAEYLSKFLNRPVYYQPDNVFALNLFPKKSNNPENLGTKKKIGINVTHFMHGYRNNLIYPPKFKSHKDFGDYNMKQQSLKYINLFRETIKFYLRNGYEVFHVPFALIDDYYAKYCFNDLKIHYLKYTPDPYEQFGRIQQFERFYSTRFHALVYCLKAAIPVKAFGYAGKVMSIFSDNNFDKSYIISRDELTKNGQDLLSTFVQGEIGLTLTNQQLYDLEKEAEFSIKTAIEKTL